MIKKFITDNEITFNEGERNSSTVVMIGYAQARGLTKTKLKSELSKEIKSDKFIGEEVERLWKYCEANNYKAFWNKPEAKKLYKF